KMLEVDDEHGVKVTAKRGNENLLELIIGAYKGGGTLVRLKGKDTVLTVEGSIKYAFNRELKEWRARKILDVDSADVQDIRLESKNGSFHFARSDKEWQPAAKQPAIERYSPSKVDSVVAALSRMRASDFAESGTTAEQAGLAAPLGTASLTIVHKSKTEPKPDGGESKAEPSAPPETIVLRLGKAVDSTEYSDYYLQREGKDTIYRVSKYLAERVMPNMEQFQTPKPEPEKKDKGDEHSAGDESKPELPTGAEHSQLPPEV